jgi:hypothetical protein
MVPPLSPEPLVKVPKAIRIPPETTTLSTDDVKAIYHLSYNPRAIQSPSTFDVVVIVTAPGVAEFLTTVRAVSAEVPVPMKVWTNFKPVAISPPVLPEVFVQVPVFMRLAPTTPLKSTLEVNAMVYPLAGIDAV